MTDTLDGYAGADNARATEPVSVSPIDVLSTDANVDTFQAVAEWMRTQDVETVRQALIDYRVKYRGAVDMREYHMERGQKMVSQVGALARQVAYESAHAKEALAVAHANANPYPITWAGWPAHLSVAFEIGIRTGHANETRNLAWHLDRAGMGTDYTGTPGESLEAMVEQIAQTLRDNNDGELPETATSTQAVADTIDRRRRVHARMPELHPADPRLADGWRTVWQIAKRDANFCDVFDSLAEALGVPDEYAPEPEPTFEGTVVVSVTLDIPVFVHGLTGTSEDHVENEGGLNSEMISDAIYGMGRGDIESAMTLGWTIDTEGLEEAEL